MEATSMLNEARKRTLTSQIYGIIANNCLSSFEADCLLIRNMHPPDNPRLSQATRQITELLLKWKLSISEAEELFYYVKENLVRFCFS